MTTYSVQILELTVYATDSAGERSDLNAYGEPCKDREGLRGFIRSLCEEGAYDAAVRDVLLSETEVSFDALLTYSYQDVLHYYKEHAEGGERGEAWGLGDHTLQEAIDHVSATRIISDKTSTDQEIVYCEHEGALYGVSDRDGPWAVLILA